MVLHQMVIENIKDDGVNSSEVFVSIVLNLHEQLHKKSILRYEATPKVAYPNFVTLNSTSAQKLKKKPCILLETYIKITVGLRLYFFILLIYKRKFLRVWTFHISYTRLSFNTL